MTKLFWQNFEEVICGVVFLCMTLLGFVNVVVRNLTNFSLATTQELLINGFVVLTVFGSAVAAKHGQHLAVTSLYDSVPRAFKIFLVLVSTLLIVLTVALCGWFTYKMLAYQYASGIVSSGLQIPQWHYTVIVPFGFVMLMIRQLELAAAEFQQLRGNQN